MKIKSLSRLERAFAGGVEEVRLDKVNFIIDLFDPLGGPLLDERLQVMLSALIPSLHACWLASG